MIIKRGDRQLKIPFGPFLSLGAITYLFFTNQIMSVWNWYLHLLAG